MSSAIVKTSNILSFSDARRYLVLFLVWPFIAFITAMFNYHQKEARKVIYIFLIYYGFTFVIGAGGDAGRYAENLQKTADLPFSDFFKVLGGLYAETSVDIVEPLVSFIVSRFTSYHGALFAVFAALFGFFYLKSINLLYDIYCSFKNWNSLIFFTFFIVLVPITFISGLRMYTAMWVYFYGSWFVIVYRDPRYLLITMSASLVHWSFFTANAILIIYYFVGNRNIVYLPIVIMSFILPQFMAPIFRSISFSLGGSIQSRYEGYSNEEYISGIQQSSENAAWFLGFGDNLAFYFFLCVFVIAQLKYGNLLKGRAEASIFSFLLLLLAFVNFGEVIPTFGGRFRVLFFLYATVFVFLFFTKLRVSSIHLITLVGMVPMAFLTAIRFRLGSESISAWLFTPGFGFPLLAPSLSLADLIFR